mgnify:CR=1 FL=1
MTPKNGETRENEISSACNNAASTARRIFAIIFAFFLVGGFVGDKQSFAEGFSGNLRTARIRFVTQRNILNNVFEQRQQQQQQQNKHCRNVDQYSRLLLVPQKQSDNQLLPSDTDKNTTGDVNNEGSVVAGSKSDSTGRIILGLAVPALGALLVDPLLTIADT